MEEAVARCPDLFIEAGLHFVRPQVVLNGRRPDILFEDVLSRHLLVELEGAANSLKSTFKDTSITSTTIAPNIPKRILALCFSGTVLFLSTKNSSSTTVTSTRRYPDRSFRGDG